MFGLGTSHLYSPPRGRSAAVEEFEPLRRRTVLGLKVVHNGLENQEKKMKKNGARERSFHFFGGGEKNHRRVFSIQRFLISKAKGSSLTCICVMALSTRRKFPFSSLVLRQSAVTCTPQNLGWDSRHWERRERWRWLFKMQIFFPPFSFFDLL